MTSEKLGNPHWFYERYGEAKLMPAVDITITIWEKYGVGVGELEVEEVIEWRNQYLKIFDLVIDQYTPKQDYKLERRNVIVQTFNRLEELVKE